MGYETADDKSSSGLTGQLNWSQAAWYKTLFWKAVVQNAQRPKRSVENFSAGHVQKYFCLTDSFPYGLGVLRKLRGLQSSETLAYLFLHHSIHSGHLVLEYFLCLYFHQIGDLMFYFYHVSKRGRASSFSFSSDEVLRASRSPTNLLATWSGFGHCVSQRVLKR